MINVKYIETENEYNSALSIRKEVFIEEQNVSIEEEIDEYEKIATHILALDNSKAVGTARWRYTDDGVKLERFAVLEPYRSHGVGRALVEFTVDELKEENLLYLNAQEYVIPFYRKFNFEEIGDIFYEAEIPHKKMVYNKEIV
jgi:predicted GNAT family N-acyltransferase|tara:strand:- start:1091 stop:1519 length:429 start_codon:yes stop_codon:yes gene_type:complete